MVWSNCITRSLNENVTVVALCVTARVVDGLPKLPNLGPTQASPATEFKHRGFTYKTFLGLYLYSGSIRASNLIDSPTRRGLDQRQVDLDFIRLTRR